MVTMYHEKVVEVVLVQCNLVAIDKSLKHYTLLHLIC